MKVSAVRSFAVATSALLAASALATAVLAFSNPLSPEDVREAYFLATGDATKREDFFAKYTHVLPVPQTGPNIQSIEVETPFACVVNDIVLTKINYHEPDAQEDYFGKPGQFRIRVQIYFTPTWPTAAPSQLGRFWDDFHIHLKQGNEIASRSEIGTPIYSDQTLSGYTGATVEADYNVNRIKTGPVTVQVTGPEGVVRAETSFDLDGLR